MTPDATRILAALKRHATAFDLTQGKLGESLCKAFTDGVQASIEAGETPDGSTWPELSAEYAQWKARHFPGQPIGKAHGAMADPEQVAGDVIVFGPEAAFVTYGTTEEAREEAAAFQEGDGHQPARPFWGFTAASQQAVGALLEARFRKIIR